MADTTTQMGLMLADDSGNVYYIRPELLEAAMVPKDMAEKALRELKQEGKPGRKNYRILGNVESKGERAAEFVATALPSRTIMCPW
jgi:hypothetical protein